MDAIRSRSWLEDEIEDLEIFLGLLCVGSLFACIFWYKNNRRTASQMDVSPNYDGAAFTRPPIPKTPKTPSPESVSVPHTSGTKAVYGRTFGLPDPTSLQTRVDIPNFTSLEFQIGSMDQGSTKRMVANSNPSCDRCELVHARDSPTLLERTSLWRFRANGSVYNIQSVANPSFYLSADWVEDRETGGWKQMTLQPHQSTDEACVVDGDVNGFKIHIRKNNGYYVAIEGNRVVLADSAGHSGTRLRAFW
jgi:hypothetical protein